MGDPPKDLYIITTAKKRDTLEWEGELSPFLLSTNPDVNLYPNKVVIDSWNNISKYKDITDAFFIFDEQRVVGSGAWVKSFLKIAKDVYKRQDLSQVYHQKELRPDDSRGRFLCYLDTWHAISTVKSTAVTSSESFTLRLALR